MLLTETISAVLQVLVFTLIPFIVYLIIHKSRKGFAEYIGLKRSNSKANIAAVVISIIFLGGGVGLAAFNETIREVMFDPESVSGKFRELGFSGATVFLLMLTAWIKTSLSEEILFRGFIGKRLIHKMGFRIGNLLQAFIFGMLHVVLFYFSMNAAPIFLIYIFLLSGIAGWACGYLNEKMANGSIIPGWIAHGLGNMVSYAIVAFMI